MLLRRPAALPEGRVSRLCVPVCPRAPSGSYKFTFTGRARLAGAREQYALGVCKAMWPELDVPLDAATLDLNCERAFALIDVNGEGTLTRAKVIKACRSDARVREMLQLPARIRQEDGTRDLFEAVFQKMDTTDSKTIEVQEFRAFWLKHVLPLFVAEIDCREQELLRSSRRESETASFSVDGLRSAFGELFGFGAGFSQALSAAKARAPNPPPAAGADVGKRLASAASSCWPDVSPPPVAPIAVATARTRARGVLQVHLKSGTGLKLANQIRLLDPYVVVRCGPLQKRSRAASKTLEALWYDVLELEGALGELVAHGLQLSVFDQNASSHDGPLGAVWVDLSALCVEDYDTKVFVEPLSTQGALRFSVTWCQQVVATSSARRHAPTAGPVVASAPEAAMPALTVTELKTALSSHGLNYSECVDKAELQGLLDAHRARVQQKLDAHRSARDSRWL